MYKKTMRIGEYASGVMYYDARIAGCPNGSCGKIYRKGENIDQTVYYSYKTPVCTVDRIACKVVVSGYRHWSPTTQKHLRAIYAEVLTQEQENMVRMSESTDTFEFDL